MKNLSRVIHSQKNEGVKGTYSANTNVCSILEFWMLGAFHYIGCSRGLSSFHIKSLWDEAMTEVGSCLWLPRAARW